MPGTVQRRTTERPRAAAASVRPASCAASCARCAASSAASRAMSAAAGRSVRSPCQASIAPSSPIGLCGRSGSQPRTPIQSRISWLTSRDTQPWRAGPASIRAQAVTVWRRAHGGACGSARHAAASRQPPGSGPARRGVPRSPTPAGRRLRVVTHFSTGDFSLTGDPSGWGDSAPTRRASWASSCSAHTEAQPRPRSPTRHDASRSARVRWRPRSTSVATPSSRSAVSARCTVRTDNPVSAASRSLVGLDCRARWRARRSVLGPQPRPEPLCG